MTENSAGRTSLTKFKDCLRVPPILRPYKTDDQRYNLRIHMRPAQVQLHSELPPSEVWTYEGLLPGPTIRSLAGNAFRSNGSTLSLRTSLILSPPSPPRMVHKMSLDAVGDRPIRPLRRFRPGPSFISMAVGRQR